MTEKTHNEKINIPSIKRINALPKKFKAVSFFAGCGGASVGYKMAGYKVLYANEFIPIAADTYEANAPGTIVDRSDIRKVKPAKLLKRLGLRRGELDLMDGSPPCQSFSTSGRRHNIWGKEVEYSEGVHQRVDDLFDEYIRMVHGFMPKVFVAENVAGLGIGKAVGYLHGILEAFTKMGYEVDARMFEPSLLGAPQRRKRLIIIGVRRDIYKKLKLKAIPYPRPRSGVVSVRDHLPHVVRIRQALGKNTKFMPPDGPSSTILASDYSTTLTAIFSGGGWIEDNKGEIRKFNIKELKKLFTFPDDFKLLGTFEQQWERLGRSHLPLATYHIGRVLRQQILEPLKALK